MAENRLYFDAPGAAKETGFSESWARKGFKSGFLPTEALINGVKPVVTGPTLAKKAAEARANRQFKR